MTTHLKDEDLFRQAALVGDGWIARAELSVNDTVTGNSWLQSGVGREGKSEGINEYLETKTFQFRGLLKPFSERPSS